MKTRGNPHVWVAIGEGPRKKLGHISFGAFEDDFDRFAERLEKLGVKRLDPPPGVETNGLWFHDHDGNLVEIKVAAKSSPNEKSEFFGRLCRPERARRAFPARRDARKARGVSRTSFSSRAMSRRRFSSIRARLASASPTGPATASPFARHPRQRPSHDRLRHIDAPGLHHLSWDVGSSTISAGASCICWTKDSRGDGAATARSRLQFFPHYVFDPRAASANIRPASTLCLLIATG